MSQLTSLTKKCSDFIIWLNNSGKSSQKCVSLPIAKALADELNLMSSEVTDIELYFKINLEIESRILISRINELVIVDMNTILDYTCKFYKHRYVIAFRPPIIVATNESTAVEDLYGINLYIDRESLCEISKNINTVMKVYNSSRNLICELKKL